MFDVKPAVIFPFDQWGFFYYHQALPQYAEKEQCHVEYVNF